MDVYKIEKVEVLCGEELRLHKFIGVAVDVSDYPDIWLEGYTDPAEGGSPEVFFKERLKEEEHAFIKNRVKVRSNADCVTISEKVNTMLNELRRDALLNLDNLSNRIKITNALKGEGFLNG